MESKHLNLYYREIIFQNPKSKKDSVCGVFSYEALNVEQANLGNLYLVGKISNIPKRKYRNSDFMLNLLASAIKRDFYSNQQRSTLEALESTLQGANIYLNDFAQKGHKEWIGNLHFAIMAFRQNQIHVSQIGNIIVQLFRENSTSNISRKFRDSETPEPIKTFSNIASGKIEEGDKVLITTNDILEIVPNAKIKELMTCQETDKLYHFIEAELKKINSLACLILEAETELPRDHKKEILEIKETPEFILDFRKILDVKAEAINKIIKDQLTFLDKFTLFILKHHIIKYIIAISILLLIILSPYLVQKINYDIKIRKINYLLSRIEENIRRSENSLVYQNQSEAQSFLRQADKMITDAYALFKNLPEDAKEKISQKLEAAKNKFESQKNTLNNIINIANAEKIADLTKNTYSFNPHGILKLENNLYLYELNSGFLHKTDLIDNNSTLVFLSQKDTFKLGTAWEDRILLLANPEKISVYDIWDDYNTYLLKPNLENTLNIKDMIDYQNDLFFLDVAKLNIWKYTLAGDILNGADWLKNPSEELKNAQSLAIDGNVFVSRENGAINEYSQGKKIREIKFEIIPQLARGGELFTREEMKNLYVLDQPNNRIISYNKKDGLIKQFTLPNLNNLKDLWVDDNETIIYLLNGLEVYRIEI